MFSFFAICMMCVFFSSSIQHRIFSPAFKSALEYFTTISISICSQFALKLAFYATDTLRFGASIRIEERAFAYIFSPLLSVFKCDYALIPPSHTHPHTHTRTLPQSFIYGFRFYFTVSFFSRFAIFHFPLVKKVHTNSHTKH